MGTQSLLQDIQRSIKIFFVSIGTNYRYIATGGFPYYLQCYRGDLSTSQELVNGRWLEYDQQNYKTCGIDDLGNF